MKTLLKWVIAGAIVAAVLVIAHDPQARIASVLAALKIDASVQPHYGSMEVVEGGNQPPAPRETPASESMDVAALESAADYAAAHDSLSLIVMRHEYIVFERFWHGSSFDTVVDSRELARVLTALATGVAISQRKIAWPDEPIGYLVPELRTTPRGEITVRQLLQLSSGLGDPAAAPGTRWKDQSADPDLLAQVIERATGQRYARYLSDSLWRPVGAAQASLWVDRPNGAAHVDRGFLARQGDWMRIADLLLHNGRYQGAEVIVPRWLPQLLQPSAANRNYAAYFHLGNHAAPGMTPYLAPDTYVAEGGGHRLWLVPSLQLAILCAARGEHRPADWDDGRIPNLIVRGTRDFVPAAARPGTDLRQLVPNH